MPHVSSCEQTHSTRLWAGGEISLNAGSVPFGCILNISIPLGGKFDIRIPLGGISNISIPVGGISYSTDRQKNKDDGLKSFLCGPSVCWGLGEIQI